MLIDFNSRALFSSRSCYAIDDGRWCQPRFRAPLPLSGVYIPLRAVRTRSALRPIRGLSHESMLVQKILGPLIPFEWGRSTNVSCFSRSTASKSLRYPRLPSLPGSESFGQCACESECPTNSLLFYNLVRTGQVQGMPSPI